MPENEVIASEQLGAYLVELRKTKAGKFRFVIFKETLSSCDFNDEDTCWSEGLDTAQELLDNNGRFQ